MKGGKVVSANLHFDNMSFMQQLGLMPPPAGAPAAGAEKITAR